MGAKTFIKKNLVALVMVPFIFGGHYTWYKLQEVDSLVSPEERHHLTITRVLRSFTSKES